MELIDYLEKSDKKNNKTCKLIHFSRDLKKIKPVKHTLGASIFDSSPLPIIIENER